MPKELITVIVSASTGLVITLALGLLVPGVMKWVRSTTTLEPPPGVSADEWKAVTDIGDKARGPIKLLGVLEQVLFFVSFWLGAYEIAGGWLAFKVASKWEGWQSIMKVPEAAPRSIDPLHYLAAKNRWASSTLQRWLLGVLLNGTFAFVGVAASRLIATWLSCCG